MVIVFSDGFREKTPHCCDDLDLTVDQSHNQTGLGAAILQVMGLNEDKELLPLRTMRYSPKPYFVQILPGAVLTILLLSESTLPWTSIEAFPESCQALELMLSKQQTSNFAVQHFSKHGW